MELRCSACSIVSIFITHSYNENEELLSNIQNLESAVQSEKHKNHSSYACVFMQGYQVCRQDGQLGPGNGSIND